NPSTPMLPSPPSDRVSKASFPFYRFSGLRPGPIIVRRHAEFAGGALPLPRGAQPAQPLDQHRVERHRLGPLDQLAEQLVVPGGGDVERLLDRLLLRPGVPEPL